MSSGDQEPLHDLYDKASSKEERKDVLKQSFSETSGDKSEMKLIGASPKFSIDGPISAPFFCAVAWDGVGRSYW